LKKTYNYPYINYLISWNSSNNSDVVKYIRHYHELFAFPECRILDL